MATEGMQPETLEQILEQELACTEALLQSLETERAALVSRDLERLSDTTHDKLAQTEALEALERQRAQLLQSLGFDNSHSGIRRCIEHRPDRDRLQTLWQQVLDNIRACRTGNLTNGGILELGRQHVEQALSVLRGENASPTLYGQKGNTAPRLGQRELGKA